MVGSAQPFMPINPVLRPAIPAFASIAIGVVLPPFAQLLSAFANKLFAGLSGFAVAVGQRFGINAE